jgi:hypothetical protein
MRDFILYLYSFLTAIASFALLMHPATVHAAACYSTPTQAASTSAPPRVEAAPSSRGYRLEGMRWDPLLEQRWAIVSSCSRPDLPLQMVPVRRGSLVSNASANIFPAVIHAGDVVLVRSQEQFIRIEFTGVADESGPMGSRVRVHLLRSSTQQMTDTANGTLIAVVRGPHEVEVSR